MTANGMFEDGDRVTRPEDVFDARSPLMHGTVIRRYERDGGFDGVTWHDPEVYEVRWDNGVIRRGYFRHGLDFERHRETGGRK
jgi:hypothetical protein